MELANTDERMVDLCIASVAMTGVFPPAIVRAGIRRHARAKAARLEAMDKGFGRSARNEIRKPIEPLTFPPALDRVLRPYQKDGVSWLLFLRKYGFGGILADEMGLGKTLEVLSFIAVTRKPGDAPDLVVCPKTLALTWEEEARRYVPWLKTLVIDGLAEEREAQIKRSEGYDVVITTYPSLQRDIRQYVARAKPFRTCALDEAQYVKNSATATAKACKLIPSEFRVALTGTPLENGVHELWSIFDFLMPDFLGSMKEFRLRFERPIRDRQDMQALERLRHKVKPFMLRRTKANLLFDLPPKVEQVSHAALTADVGRLRVRSKKRVPKSSGGGERVCARVSRFSPRS